ncbi:tripartite tricarboxylate transporter permease [Devosia elaeis]|uniref:Tricarboxylate transporter n=1 Tax=Devosia elaeis TaxID=1770058 RepID=A0A178HR89_9HYPH|nr:tripartite tricarboxylate transporter permease [Devosia elaeis]OAM74526.1 tricarboxylate transporter [Devosia elaeis]
MIDVLLHALQNLFTLTNLGFMLVGVTVGLVVGILPALGGIAGMSLLLPFVYGMEPTSAVAMMVGLLAVIPTSDTFSSILMGIPGSAASQATVLDGFPLARKGEAARALSASFSASLVAGLFGALCLTGIVIVARPLILSFSSAELFMLALFGLSMVGVLAGNNLAKGVAACALGLAVGCIGTAPAAGGERMSFGSLYMMSGIEITIIGLGIFALPEVIDLLRSNASISSTGKLGKGWLDGLKDTWTHRFLMLRTSGIGAMIGLIPGLGGSVSDWISYAHTVQTSKDKSQFGKGDIRGVIGPEAANNSCAGGNLIPTLLFGIPGSGSMAIFLAAMILIGLQPGPAMADPNRDLDLTYTVVWTLAIANVVGTAACILLSPSIARLTTIRFVLFAPFMILIVTFGAYQATRSFEDLIALLVVGLLGIFLKRFGWPRPAFLIGFVLAGQVETYFYQAVQFYGFAFPLRPVAIVIAVLTVVSVWFSTRKRKPTEPLDPAIEALDELEEESKSVVASNIWPQVIFTGLTLGWFAFAIIDGSSKSFLDKVFPITVGLIGVGASLLVLWPQLMAATGRRKIGGSFNFDLDANRAADFWPYVAWIVGFILATGVVGFFLALVGFFIGFLRLVAKAGWLQTLALTVGAVALILVLTSILRMNLPGGLLQHYFYDALVWPLR